MPFIITKKDEALRVQRAAKQRDVSLVKTAKERCILMGWAMKHDPEMYKELRAMNARQDDDIVAVAQEIFGAPAYEEA